MGISQSAIHKTAARSASSIVLILDICNLLDKTLGRLLFSEVISQSPEITSSHWKLKVYRTCTTDIFLNKQNSIVV